MCRRGTSEIALGIASGKRAHKLRGKEVDTFGIVAATKAPASAKSGQAAQRRAQGFGGRVGVEQVSLHLVAREYADRCGQCGSRRQPGADRRECPVIGLAEQVEELARRLRHHRLAQ